jgi:hypothetical protein
VDEPQLRTVLQELDKLSHEEYRKSLAEIAASGDEKKRLDRLGRLVGVVMKKPFATEYYSDTPSPHTEAYRGWELNEAAFRNETALSSWQAQALAAIRQDKHVIDTLGYQIADIEDLARTAQYERGWFSFLVVACREYLCNPQVRQKIDGQVQAARQAGFDVRDPNTLVGTGAGAIGTILVQNVPILRLVNQDRTGVQVIVLLTIIVSNVGVNAFCLSASERDQDLHMSASDQDTSDADPPKP